MSRVRILWLMAVLAAVGVAGLVRPLTAHAAQNAAPASVVLRSGQSLGEALEALRRLGLGLIYSERLVTSELRVGAAPLLEPQRLPADPAQRREALARIAAQLLAPHGLRLEPVSQELYAIVRVVDPDATPRLPDAADGTAGDPTTATSDPPARVETITVYASRYRVEAGGTAPVELSGADLQRLPGIDEDVLRVARYLPGNATNGLSARTNVRGGRDDEVGVYFDGVPLHAPYHFKDYQAVLGVLDPAAIERLDFYSGVFPSRYGDRLSGIMDLAPRELRGGDVQHAFGLSLLAAHALSVGETEWRGAPLRWLASGRGSTTQLVAKAAGREDIHPEFLDLVLRGERVLGNDWSLTLGALALQDELQYRDVATGRDDLALADYQDATGWIGLRRRPNDGLTFDATLSGAHRRTDRGGSLQRLGAVDGTVRDLRETESRHLRVELQRSGRWLLGLEASRIDTGYDYRAAARFDPLLATLFARAPSFARSSQVNAEGSAISLYGSRFLEPAPKWRVDLGMRIDERRYEASGGGVSSRFDGTAVSPRLALEYAWGGRTTLRAGLGRVTQAERPDELQISEGEPVYHALQVADQAVFGIEHRFGRRGSLRAEAYRKDVRDPAPRYENLLDPVTLLPELEVDRRRVAPTDSLLYGIELTGRLELSKQWSGWLIYSWSEATDEFPAGARALRSWNQKHSIATGAAWRSGSWDLSANLQWHSGWRRTVLIGAAPGAGAGLVVSGGAGAPIGLEERNGSSWPDFFSLDLRASWLRELPLGRLRVHADLSNATDRSNPCCTELAILRGAGTAGRDTIAWRERGWLPRYVLVGVDWEWP